MKRVFRDYRILLAAPELTQPTYKEMLSKLGFGKIDTTNDDRKVIKLIKKTKPKLVVLPLSFDVFSGPQLLSAIRQDKETKNTPVLIFGVKEDLKVGDIEKQVKKAGAARIVGMPVSDEGFSKSVVDLLDPFIDPNQEESYKYLDEADKKAEEGNIRDAVKNYKKSVELYENNEKAWIKLAGAYLRLESFDEAESTFLRVLEINKYSMEAYISLADIYEQRHDYEQTIGVLKQALGIAQLLKASPQSQSRLNFFIGEFELRLKRLSGAEQAFSKAIELDQENAELRSDIGDAYAEKGYLEESEKYYTDALDIDPNLAHVYNRLGIAYRKQEKYEKAIQLYNQARQHHPDDENLLFNIARALFEGVDPAGAIAALEEALSLSPEFREAKSLMAMLKQSLNGPGGTE